MRDAASVSPSPPEGARNRLLRRADWRFLLPDPAPERALSFAVGRLRDAITAAAGVVHSIDAVTEAEYDLVVASDPDADTTRRALAMLRAGGAFYSEWTGVRALDPSSVRRSLVRGGARALRLYWPWPWPTLRPTRYWLPLESPAAAALLRSEAAPARQPVLRAGGRVLNSFERALLGGGIRYPLVAVAIKDAHEIPGSHASGGRPALAGSLPFPRELAEPIASSGCAERSEDRLSWLLLTPGPRTISKVVGLVLPGSSGPPVCAVKMARVAEAESGLAREAAALTSVRALTPAAAGAAPELLFSVQTRVGLAVGERARVGRPLWRDLDRGSHAALARRVTEWLVGLVHRRPADRDWQERRIEAVIDDFTRMFGGIAEPGLLRRTRELVRALPPLPATFEHRDLGPWNVLLEEHGFAVLDWESSERDGFPALDLLYFLTYLSLFAEDAMENSRTLPVFRASLDPATRTGRIRKDCLDLYARSTGLAAEALPALRLLVWMIHSRSDHGHLTADIGGPPPVELLRESLFLRLWTEEARSVMIPAQGQARGAQAVRA